MATDAYDGLPEQDDEHYLTAARRVLSAIGAERRDSVAKDCRAGAETLRYSCRFTADGTLKLLDQQLAVVQARADAIDRHNIREARQLIEGAREFRR